MVTAMTEPSLPAEVLRHYVEEDESLRLADGLGELEFVRVQQIVGRPVCTPSGSSPTGTG